MPISSILAGVAFELGSKLLENLSKKPIEQFSDEEALAWSKRFRERKLTRDEIDQILGPPGDPPRG